MPVLEINQPCYVEFETRPMEDREASEREGFYVARDVIIATIMPPGAIDTVEKIADEWVEEKKAMRDPHAEFYERAFKGYMEGHEIPEEGTYIKNWPPIQPAMAEQCIRANVRTVEDLATAPESALVRIGMGSRELSKKALIWLETAAKVGIPTEVINSLQVQINDLKDEMKRKDEIISKLQTGGQVDGTEGRVTRGPRPKE